MYTLTHNGQAKVYFKIKFDCGATDFRDFASFQAEGRRLLEQFQDPSFYYDENPELAGVVMWMISLGSKYHNSRLDILSKNFTKMTHSKADLIMIFSAFY